MRAELKGLHSPDIFDLKAFEPEDPKNLGFLLQAMIGAQGESGEESFDSMVCTPRWLEKQCSNSGPLLGTHHLFVFSYDYERIRNFIETYCFGFEGNDWEEVAEKVRL